MKLELQRSHVIQRVEFDGYSWFFHFSDEGWIRTGCLWRLLRNGRITLTSNDHGQLFGLTQPVDAEVLATAALTGKDIISIAYSDETADLGISVDGNFMLQILPDSIGHETWDLTLEGKRYLAQSGNVYVT